MGSKTNIEWATATWNPWLGCRKVSAACDNCYMYRDMRRYGQNPKAVRKSKTNFDAPSFWNRGHKLDDESRIFVCSWSDFFIEEADEWRDEAWNIIKENNNFKYLILTKRPERVKEHLPKDWDSLERYEHIWFGVTVEQNKHLDRIGILFDAIGGINALASQYIFVSCEPMLEAVDFSEHMGMIDQIIVGGESGPNAREMQPDWARDVRDDCKRHGVSFFMKQMTGKQPIPKDLMIRENPIG